MRKPTHVYATQSEWLASRADTRGASEVAAVLGRCAYRDAYQVYWQKKGALGVTPTIPMRRGLHDEPFVARLYTEETGCEVIDYGQYAVWESPTVPGLRATPDRLTFPLRVVELKTMDSRSWQGVCPIEYEIQVQIQMHCCGAERGDVAILVHDALHVFEFERNDKFLASALPHCAEFLRRLRDDDPPEPTATSIGAVEAVYPEPEPGKCVTLDAGAIAAAEEYRAAEQERREVAATLRDITKWRDEAEAKLRAALGDAEYGEGGGYSVKWATVHRKAYSVDEKQYRKMTVKEDA